MLFKDNFSNKKINKYLHYLLTNNVILNVFCGIIFVNVFAICILNCYSPILKFLNPFIFIYFISSLAYRSIYYYELAQKKEETLEYYRSLNYLDKDKLVIIIAEYLHNNIWKNDAFFLQFLLQSDVDKFNRLTTLNYEDLSEDDKCFNLLKAEKIVDIIYDSDINIAS